MAPVGPESREFLMVLVALEFLAHLMALWGLTALEFLTALAGPVGLEVQLGR